MSFICLNLLNTGLSYSFMGRHFERLDSAYSTYSGYLHMEASKYSMIKWLLKKSKNPLSITMTPGSLIGYLAFHHRLKTLKMCILMVINVTRDDDWKTLTGQNHNF
jgi:hypothetical protein